MTNGESTGRSHCPQSLSPPLVYSRGWEKGLLEENGLGIWSSWRFRDQLLGSRIARKSPWNVNLPKGQRERSKSIAGLPPGAPVSNRRAIWDRILYHPPCHAHARRKMPMSPRAASPRAEARGTLAPPLLVPPHHGCKQHPNRSPSTPRAAGECGVSAASGPQRTTASPAMRHFS